jgi:hemerythrin
MYQSGPYGPNHATAGTFAFRTELLKHTSYENHAALAEEKHFLKDYTIPFAQLDPLKTILVFSHEHNTFDKRKLLDNQHQDFFKISNKTVNDFIRTKKEEPIKQFFMKDIDNLLKVYKPGEPCMKPDVLLQIKQIEQERKNMMEQQGAPQMMINEEGKPPRPISPNEIVQLMNQQMEQIKQLTQKNQSLETMVANLQKKISQHVQAKSEKPEKSEKSEKSEKPEKSEKNAFTDILLARINELEKIVHTLKNSVDDNKPNLMDSAPVIDKPVQKSMVKSKTMPEVKVNIR